MSRPLLSTSPTVDLRINSGRELEARVIADPSINNALRIGSDGLYVKRGVRTNPWSVTRLSPYAAVGVFANPTQANQAFSWATESLDPDDLVDLVNQPTRVTVAESGYFWSSATAIVQAIGATSATTAASTAEFVQLVNGTKWVGGSTNYSFVPIGTTVTFESITNAYVYLNAGDYLECFWRWILHESQTATSWAWQGQWSGGRIAE